MYDLINDYDLVDDTVFPDDAAGYHDWNYDSYEDAYLSSNEAGPQPGLFGYFGGVSILHITNACVLPTVVLVCSAYFPTLLACVCFQKFSTYIADETYKHLLSGLLGIGLLYLQFHQLILHVISLALVAYVFIKCMWRRTCSTSVISVLLLVYLTACEFTFELSSWARIRNVQMLIVMKVISLMADFDKRRIQRFPSFFGYFGYIFCVSNCMFGPWTDYGAYMDMFKPKTWTISYLISILKAVIYSLLSFCLSMCYVDWMLHLEEEDSYLSMYGKALEFRTGHYFVMFMSESLMLASGFDKPLKHHDVDSYLTRPSRIELPHSLVEVVVYWNVPMHKWLKIYVFKPLAQNGNFVAVIGTYFVSSLLHGLNCQLSAILLSLAFYTYVEHTIRRKLARRFDACISSRPCEQYCRIHTHNGRKLIIYFINKLFTVLALYHLSYLGYLTDLRADSEDVDNVEEPFYRWKLQNFNSHALAFITYFVSLFL